MNPVRIPKFLLKPVEQWIEFYGMKRAIKVLKVQAIMLRRAGNIEGAIDLMTVATALSASINKGAAVAESITLGWDVP